MKELTISKEYERAATRVMKVTGFTERELSELNSMDYREMMETVIAAIEIRNGDGDIGLYEGSYILTAWINDGAVFLEIGR